MRSALPRVRRVAGRVRVEKRVSGHIFALGCECRRSFVGESRLDGSRDASAPRRAVFPLAGSDVVFRNSPRGASLTRPTTARAWRGEGERRWRPRRGALGLPGRVAANGRRPSQEKPFRPLLGEEIARRHGFHHFLRRRARRYHTLIRLRRTGSRITPRYSTGTLYTAVGGVDGTCGAPVDGISSFASTAIGDGSGRGCRRTQQR